MVSEQTKPKNAGTTSLFQNPLLEKLTRTHAAVPISMYFIISAGVAWYGIDRGLISLTALALSFLPGLLTFTWVEYNVHRHVFHMLPDTPFKASIQYKFHGVHHEFPKDKTRLAMPPVASLVISSLFFGLFYLVMGHYAFGFLPGFLTGYALYLWVHYAVHAYRPPQNFLRVLWINHGIHHYKSNSEAFGVSSPLWDYIYGTMPRK